MAGSGDDRNSRRGPPPAPQMPPGALNTTHRLLSLAQQIAINDPSEIRNIGAVIQGKAAQESLSERPKKLAKLLKQSQAQSGVSDQVIRKLGSDLEMVVAFHQLSQLQVNSFVNENSTLDPISAFQKAIAVPRNHVASTFKASWRHEHESHFNSQFNSNMFSTVGSLHSGPLTQSMAVSSRLRAGGPSTIKAHGRRRMPVTKRSHIMSILFAVVALLGLAYLGVRIWDIVELYREDGRVSWIIYRIYIALVEALFGAATLAYLRLGFKFASSEQPRNRRTFTPEALVSILYATDETADTIVAAVMAHTHARRPRRIPIKLIVIAQRYTPEVVAAQERVAKLVANVSFLDHQQLADHEPVTRLLEDAVPIIETLAIPRRMTMAQALYLCLTGINIKYPLDHVLVSVSDASVIVNQAEHYKYAISRLSRADTAVVSFPSTPRNENSVADLLDLGLRDRQGFTLPATFAEGHCVVHSTCFSARGPELFNVLRAMELENAGSRTFDWLPFFVHLDPANAKSASFDADAPMCSVLVHKHGRTRLASKLFTVTESWDVAAFLGRQFGRRWRWTSGMYVPHIMNRMTTLLEVTALIVILVTTWGRIQPASPANVLLAATFLLYYAAVVASGLVTARGAHASWVGRLLTNRILVPFFVTVYSFTISRFGVDRRGHFQSVGDITTQQIFGLKRPNGGDADDMHVPLMAVPHDPAEGSTDTGSDKDLWAEDEPDAATLDSWASLGFSSNLPQSGRSHYQRSSIGGFPELTPSSSRNATNPIATPSSGVSPSPTPRPPNAPGSRPRSRNRPGPAAEGVETPDNSEQTAVAVFGRGRGGGRRCDAGPVAEGARSRSRTPETPITPVALGEGREGRGLNDAELSARLANLDDDSGAMPAPPPSSGPMNSFNYWRNPPENLPKKVTQQEFIDHAAANAAKAPGGGTASTARSVGRTGRMGRSAGRSGDSIDASSDMRHWSGDRTGQGIVSGLSSARIGAASIMAAAVVTVCLVAAFVSIRGIVTGPANAGYTTMERFAANPWDVSTVCLAALLVIPPVILLANVVLPGRAISILIHNRVSAAVLLLVSAIALLGVPAVHIFSNITAYDEFSSSMNFSPVPIRELADASTEFLALQQAGPLPGEAQTEVFPGRAVRGPIDVGLKNERNGAALHGGWITGPGNAKVTLPIAAVVADLAFALVKYPQELNAMGVQEKVIAQVRHGADYLKAAYAENDGSLVSHVYSGSLTETGNEWLRAEDIPAAQRTVKWVSGDQGTEIHALTSAAFAASAIALRALYDGRPDEQPYVDDLQRLARTTFEKHVDKPGQSYAQAHPDLAAVWPPGNSTDSNLADEQFFANAWIVALFPKNTQYRDMLNYYFSYSEESHDWRPCTVDVDNFFVSANLVMAHFEGFDPRYRLHVERCVATWTGQTLFGREQPSPLRVMIDGEQMLLQRTAYAGPPAPDVAGPRPLPLSMRAMAAVAAYTAPRIEPEEVPERQNLAAACFSIQQTRLLLGYNAAKRSYVVGVAGNGAGWPQAPRVRAASCDAGACGGAEEAPGRNPTDAYGAFVHGPDMSGTYIDSRTDAVHNGVNVLNSSPMVLLAAAHARIGLKPQDCLGMGLGLDV